MAFCHQFISEDPANCGFSLYYFVMLRSCTLSVDACSPNLHIGNCTESKGSVHPSLVLGCISPAASCTYFFFFYQLSPVPAQFSVPPGIYWACASCTVPLQPSSVPTLEPHTAQYMLVFPQHTKCSQQYYFCWTIHLLFQVLYHSSKCTE